MNKVYIVTVVIVIVVFQNNRCFQLLHVSIAEIKEVHFLDGTKSIAFVLAQEISRRYCRNLSDGEPWYLHG